ncbi:hypothetical protein CLVI_14370 [Clostridium vincentii]|uniref:Uncharacterized protein n=1 Tax=Clostridium vincentii TaxID=52704 RepID=A0A2T0BFY5_9CLOT|nr:hypothetical protein CLVI_14370 [Clostridium vincentii]
MIKQENVRNKRVRRIDRFKKKKKRQRRLAIIFLILISIVGYSLWQLYNKNQRKDLQYAVEQSLTSGNSDDRLLRVQNIDLLFNDSDAAVVEVIGLSKKEPHSTTKIKGSFRKGFMDSWNLESTSKIEI